MTIEVLVGMICAGKSTYARRRADEGAIVVAYDDITQALHCRYRYEQGLRGMYRRIEESIAWAALDCNKDVIIDRTQLTRESRERWTKWARDYDSLSTYEGKGPTTRVIAVVFPIAAASIHAGRRFEADPRGRPYEEWLAVATHHEEQAKAEPITPNEGFDEVRYKSWDQIS